MNLGACHADSSLYSLARLWMDDSIGSSVRAAVLIPSVSAHVQPSQLHKRVRRSSPPAARRLLVDRARLSFAAHEFEAALGEQARALATSDANTALCDMSTAKEEAAVATERGVGVGVDSCAVDDLSARRLLQEHVARAKRIRARFGRVCVCVWVSRTSRTLPLFNSRSPFVEPPLDLSLSLSLSFLLCASVCPLLDSLTFLTLDSPSSSLCSVQEEYQRTCEDYRDRLRQIFELAL
jgi:hypothetical protein